MIGWLNLLEVLVVVNCQATVGELALSTEMNSKNYLKESATKIASILMSYYTTNPGSDGQGAIRPSSNGDYTGIQW